MSAEDVAIFALNASKDFGEKVCAHLHGPLCAHEEREFEDGEHRARPVDPVAGVDLHVIHSLHGGPEHSANDRSAGYCFSWLR